MTNDKIEKALSAHLVTARTLTNSLVDEGIVDEERLRLTIAARVKESKQLTASLEDGGQGLSRRQAAKVLGVDEGTVRNDLRNSSAESADNLRTEERADVKSKENQNSADSGQIQTEAAITIDSGPVAAKRQKHFETIVIDPPWPMTKIERDVRPNQTDIRTGDVFDYPTMDERELREFAAIIDDMADFDCHMFMWTTQKNLPLAMKLVEAYGFKYVLAMVWHKPGGYQPTGLPQFNCEFVIYGRRGAPKFIDTKGFPCCFNAPRREHSRKPDEFYDIVGLVTRGPRIDVFSREAREGFEQFGNETSKFKVA